MNLKLFLKPVPDVRFVNKAFCFIESFKTIAKKWKQQFFRKICDYSLFRKVYLITLLLEFTAFTDVFALWAKSFVLFFGALIIVRDIFTRPQIFDIECKRIIAWFLISGCITTFVNMSSDFLVNLIFVFHSVVCFFIFFGIEKNTARETISEEIDFVFKFITAFFCVISVLGFAILFFGTSVEKYGYTLGILSNRFIGICTNSNLAGFIAVISLVGSDLIYKQSGKIFKKIIIISAIFSILTLFLSDSNASFVFLTVYLVARIFCENFLKYSSISSARILRETLFLIVCVILMISGSVILRIASQHSVSLLINRNKLDPTKKNISEIDTEDLSENFKTLAPTENTKIGRNNHDVSSGRITLFKQGLELFKVSPLIGIGRGNLVKYGQIYLDGGLIFSDLHNSYLTILVSYGAIGFLLFLFFCVLVILKLFRKLTISKYNNDSEAFIKLFSAFTAYLAYATFEKGILSEITFMSVYFWLILSYAVSHY